MPPGDDDPHTLRGDAVWQRIDADIIVLDPNTVEHFAIRGAGVLLWPALVDGASVAQLAAVLVDEFGIDSVTAHTDARTFVDDLIRRDLLVSGEAGNAGRADDSHA
jgi:hypothetical protein